MNRCSLSGLRIGLWVGFSFVEGWTFTAFLRVWNCSPWYSLSRLRICHQPWAQTQERISCSSLFLKGYMLEGTCFHQQNSLWVKPNYSAVSPSTTSLWDSSPHSHTNNWTHPQTFPHPLWVHLVAWTGALFLLHFGYRSCYIVWRHRNCPWGRFRCWVIGSVRPERWGRLVVDRGTKWRR